jgi:hypothetical protein
MVMMEYNRIFTDVKYGDLVSTERREEILARITIYKTDTFGFPFIIEKTVGNNRIQEDVPTTFELSTVSGDAKAIRAAIKWLDEYQFKPIQVTR